MGDSGDVRTAVRRVLRALRGVILPPGVPPRKLFPILLMLFIEGVAATSIMAYVPYMVLDLGVTSDPQKVGYYAGFISSSFFICQFASSFFIGVLSDKIGRRPVLLSGTLGLFISMLLFGFSWSYPVALVARSINGLMDGNMGVAKTYLGEVTDSTNRIQTFAFFGLMYGIGSIVGSTLGGLTARPAITMPKVFSPKGLFGKFPYLLPNAIIAVLVLVNFILGYIFLTENQHSRPENLTKPMKQLQEEERNLTSSAHDDDGLRTSEDADSSPVSSPTEPDTSTAASSTSHTRHVLCSQYSSTLFQTIRKWALPFYMCCLYAFNGFVQTSVDALFPVWAAADVNEGGLGFTSSQIGLVSAVGGVSMILTQLFIYKRIAKRIKCVVRVESTLYTMGSETPQQSHKRRLLWTNRLCCLVLAPLFVAVPFISLLAPACSGCVWAAVLSYVWVYQLFRQCGMAVVITFIVNAVCDEDMAKANGIGQSAVALTRAVGPSLITPMLAWSFHNTGTFAFRGKKNPDKSTYICPFCKGMPFDYHFPFFFVAAMQLLGALLTIHLPTTLNEPHKSKSGCSSCTTTTSNTSGDGAATDEVAVQLGVMHTGRDEAALLPAVDDVEANGKQL
eukprot:TRINITY_DN781_c0_g1_i9.p1 TRINITY_DN781_c0_g1~~TRINITY_DN781_c0_g1_i9.p1  ORF type:complete len:619 (-),score=125.27 TRINITY_DN781_c0_g1_i9:42-1898(-)